MKYFHASPFRLEFNAVISHFSSEELRGSEPSFSATERDGRLVGVYLTNSVAPHHTIAPTAREGRWWVYEVRPLGRVWFSGTYGEWCADACVVVRCVHRLSVKGGASWKGKKSMSGGKMVRRYAHRSPKDRDSGVDYDQIPLPE